MVFLVQSIFIWSSNSIAKEIIIAADPWCPYNCEPNSSNPGFQVEVLREALKPFDISVRYRKMPYTRALKLAENNKIDGVFGALQGESQQLVFPDENVGFSYNVAVTQSDNNWWFVESEDLKGKNVVAIEGYSYGPKIDKYLKNIIPTHVNWMYGEKALKQALKLISVNRADVFFEDVNVVKHKIRELGLIGKLKVAGAVSAPQPAYIAFSKKANEQYDIVRKFNEGVKRLRHEGRLKKIFDKYGLSELAKTGKQSAIVTIAADNEWKPFYGPDLPEEGVLMSLIHASLKAGGFTPESKYISWTRAMKATASGEYDLIAGIYFSKERAKKYSYSEPIMNVNAAFISRKGEIDSVDWEKLKGKKIAIVEENELSEDFVRHSTDLDLVKVRTTEIQTKLFNRGRVELVAVSNALVFLHIAKEQGFPIEEYVVHEPYLKVHPVYVAVSKASDRGKELLKAFNAGLQKIKMSGEYDKIRKRLDP